VPPAVSHKQLITRCLPGKGYTGPAPMTSKGRDEARTSALVSATHRNFPASIRLEIASSRDSLLEGPGFETSIPLTKYVRLSRKDAAKWRSTGVASNRRTILAGPRVRIPLPPAESQRTFGSS